ncbi:hypothetical protein ABZZ79_01660 [Streptomyces sp. NPDC006458]|uniref:hypothetical protein n=1 Tax=Streptomyces sp. NPDC006458 TaxID=3154302 RepID=UPI00339FC0B6
MRRSLSTVAAALALAAGTVIGTSSEASAATAPGCSDAHQIGNTAYITTSSGETAASVKQYYGCNKNFGYVYVWQSFRDTHSSWRIFTWINTTPGTYLGLMSTTGIEVWSNGTATAQMCTRAGGLIEFGSYSFQAYTDTRC